MRNTLFAAALLIVLPSFVEAESIWVEGEDASRATVQRHNWYDSVKPDVLSGGKWLSHYGDRPGEAEYEINAATAGRHVLWARLNPVASKPQWRLDGGKWADVDLKDKRGQQNAASDNKPDHRFVAWLKVADLDLAKGKHTVAFRWEGAVSNSGALDCFVLTSDGFVPQGILKPSSTPTKNGPADWFPLLADEDPLSPESVIDMSSLVPAPAGQFGFLAASGKDLKFEKQKSPVKFWGCGANVEPGHYSREQLAQRAKWLRKFGINIVRQHPLFDELSINGRPDPRKLDEYDYWFAELKKNGIHTCWSVFYHFTIGPDDGYDRDLYAELDGSRGLQDTYGIICISPKLWEIRNRTLVSLLQRKNPYTGLRYVDDPALVVVEMNNEDSVFFWNPLGWLAEGKRMPRHSKQLRERFAAWVKARYKTDAALKAAWGPLRAGDSVSARELAVMSPRELPGEGPRGTFEKQTRRAGDYIQFLAELQRSNFETCEKAIRGAGFKAVTVTTGWQVGGAATEAANIWTDCVGGMIDRHNYLGGGAGGHGIADGKVNNESHLGTPGGGLFSIGMKQVEDKPFSITEWTQSPPNQWKAEAAPIMAFYGMGLQGWDASFHFMQHGTRLDDGWPRMSSYATETPHYLGQFPALAFALARGHIQEAPIVAARRISKKEMFSGTDPLKQDATQGGYDAKTLVNLGGTPPEAFAIGRVTVAFEGKSQHTDLSKFWDSKAKVLKSATGELTWDYGRQVITVQSPRTQAVIGRTGGRTFSLPGATATFQTPFVSVIFTPLDDVPLAESRRILITALAQDKLTGTKYNADGTRLDVIGAAPLLLEPVQATVKFAGVKPKSVTPCDHYGRRMSTKPAITPDGAITLDGTHRAYYYEVTR